MHPLAGTPLAFWMTSLTFWSHVLDQASAQRGR